ncbi:negative regulator of the PHO system-like [Selaginella moellendorffii]|uniref:negative regulator of the PHO system-like n=1 Tax=Selaginella moellendorffii TaxID=88036 RepID=UPI000D1CE827|nr:negative regulator of the PHO system-like [Selaginella moellendorffii]|eukprot:XP_024536120.1 negative regulator of the PHO system-like [Selaginella moellendorffii]
MARGYAGSKLFLRRLRQFIRKANGLIRECSVLEEHWEWLVAVKYDRELEIEEIVEELHFMCGLIGASPIQAFLPQVYAVAQLDKAVLEKQLVAVKEFHHLSPELRALSSIQAAPHIVQTIGYYKKVDESCTHLVMEVMRMDLKEYASKNKGLTHLQLVEMLLQITKGLEFLHGTNIVHRDLKPKNVLIDFTDEDEE